MQIRFHNKMCFLVS